MIEKTPRLTIAQATTLALRFREMPGFPKEEIERRDFTGEVETLPGPGQQALIRAFQSAAHGIAHGERLCQMLEDGVRVGDDENAVHFAPQPPDVYYAAMRLAAGNIREFDGLKTSSCPKCQDTGFACMTHEDGSTSAEFCSCHPAYKPRKQAGSVAR